MKILVWQWGRFGAGPRLGQEFASVLAGVPGVTTALSLSDRSEILQGAEAPRCDLKVSTYRDVASYIGRVLTLPGLLRSLRNDIATLAPDVALCAMPGPLDLAMHLALRRLGVPYAVVVHDASQHPGDGYPLQMMLQRQLLQRADALVVLSRHVERGLAAQGLLGTRTLIRSSLPQAVIEGLPPIRSHGGKFRLLSFGRLLAYKGLDLLAEALARLLPAADIEVRVVGEGPEGADLAALRRLPGVTVENRWVPESEINSLLGWADGLVLSHREASQSGVAAAALAAGRFLVATRIGGLAEQAADQPGALLCDVSVDGLTDALKRMLTLPAPESAKGFSAADAAALAAQLRAIRGVRRGAGVAGVSVAAPSQGWPGTLGQGRLGGAKPLPPNPPAQH